MNLLKKIATFCKQKAKRAIIDSIRYLPISSKYIGSPKGCYDSSKEYWQTCEINKLKNVAYTPFLPPFISERYPPRSIYAGNHWKFEEARLHNHNETFVVTIPNGRFLETMSTIITHDDRVILDVSLQFGLSKAVKNSRAHQALNFLKLPKCKQIPGTVAVLSSTSGDGYFHWLTDALPRLEIIRKTIPLEIDAIDKYIVNKGIPIIAESLQMLGIEVDQIIFVDSSNHIEADRLIVPSLAGSTGNPPLWVCNFLRESFIKHKAEITPISKLYISRSKARYRKVTNEQNVIKYLSKLGFTTVWLEDHNFATQIALFYNAEFIISPHGAGLTNLIWCKPGTKLLEIFSPNYVNVCYWAIADLIGIEYYYMIGQGEKPSDYTDPHLVEDHINISMKELIQSLENTLNSEV